MVSSEAKVRTVEELLDRKFRHVDQCAVCQKVCTMSTHPDKHDFSLLVSWSCAPHPTNEFTHSSPLPPLCQQAGVKQASSLVSTDDVIASPLPVPPSSSSSSLGNGAPAADTPPAGQSAPELLYSKLVELGLLRR